MLILKKTDPRYGVDNIELPCGKCIGCRLNYSRVWANRLMLESKSWSHNWFFTLTYDDTSISFRSRSVRSDTGEVVSNYSLVPRDLQLFIKRLRKHFGAGVRFFACGEYGDKTMRPHYHISFFNLPLTDLVLYKKDKVNSLYVSKLISSLWGKGHVVISPMTWETNAYVARYVMKKQVGFNKSVYDKLDIVPEFVRMSRRPGIARDYYEKKRDIIYFTDELFVRTSKGVQTFKPPRYFDNLFRDLSPDSLEKIKQLRRSYVLNKLESLANEVDGSMSRYFSMLEKSHIDRSKRLKRGL